MFVQPPELTRFSHRVMVPFEPLKVIVPVDEP
jgi:hypothetical protein